MALHPVPSAGANVAVMRGEALLVGGLGRRTRRPQAGHGPASGAFGGANGATLCSARCGNWGRPETGRPQPPYDKRPHDATIDFSGELCFNRGLFTRAIVFDTSIEGVMSMVSRLIKFTFSPPRRRAFARGLSSWSPRSAIESLEERTLLSASLALFNGSFAGSYKGSETVNNNGHVSTITVNPSAFQATIVNGVASVTIAGGTGTGIVGSNGSLSGTVNTTIAGQPVAVAFTGSVTAANNSTTQTAGSWSFSTSLGGGVTVTGQGTWAGSSAVVVTDFDGNYNGSYQGTLTVNNNGSVSTIPVSPTAFQTANANGTIADTFAAGSPLSNGTGTINAQGNINSSVTYTQNGVPITVTATGHATRSLSSVVESGTWTFTVNLGGGVRRPAAERGRPRACFRSMAPTPGRLTARPRSTTTERSPPLRFRTRSAILPFP